MASIGHDAGGLRRILFYASDGSRKTIRLGKCSKRDATSIKVRVEQLQTAKLIGSMDRDLSIWIAELEPALRIKLESVGLLESAEADEAKGAVTLDAFLTDFLERKGADKKPATKIVWGQVMSLLREYMPDGILLSDVTVGHAKSFVDSLRNRGLASSTVYKRVGFARQFFEDAVDWELIDRNPFAKVKTSQSSRKSNVNVSMDKIERILKHCDTTWATIVTLSRLGGLRCPSEVLSLQWGHVDWESERMHVPECKVEHHEGRGIRDVPIFGELRPYLETAFTEATVGGRYPSPETYVVDKPAYRKAAMRPGGWANANLRSQFLKIMGRAGVDAWPRLFHSMRASRETELLRKHPKHVVCAWMGNTAAVADRHYNLVTEEDFQDATKSPETRGTKSGTIDAQNGQNLARNPAPQVPATSTQETKKAPQNIEENVVSSVFYGALQMEDNGLEPMTSCMPCRRSPN